MPRLLVLSLGLGGVCISFAHAQKAPAVDSLVAEFIERGATSRWLPFRLFEGCPNMEEWQERGFRLLASADLSRERSDHLALAWLSPLRECNDARLEQWYFEKLNEAIALGHAHGMIGFWMALESADSHGIREYLWNLMLDTEKPASVRGVAGTKLFARFGPEERMREYLRAFETMRMPSVIASGVTRRLLEDRPERLLTEVGRLVAADPMLGDQTAFAQIVHSSARYADGEARRRLGESLKAGLARAGAGVTGRQRERLESAAEDLLRPPR